jgi:hypothetical protein
MAKKYIFYANRIDLAKCPVTQNEKGVYYYNGSSYFKPTLGIFDNASYPSGYKKYTNGSHLQYISNLLRSPIDFSLNAEVSITSNVDVKILNGTLQDHCWVKTAIVGTNINPAFVHCYKWAPIGSIVKAGDIICKVAPKSVTGYSPHLHLDIWGSYSIRNLILTGDVTMADIFKIGDYVTFTGSMNLRKGAGDGFSTSAGITAGAVGRIKDGPRTSQNKLFYGKGSTSNVNDAYTWFDVQFLDSSGWIAQTSRFVKSTSTKLTNLNGTIPTPPVIPTPTEPTTPSALELAQKEIGTLKTEIEGLKTIVGGLNEKFEVSESARIIAERSNEEIKGAVRTVISSIENVTNLIKV